MKHWLILTTVVAVLAMTAGCAFKSPTTPDTFSSMSPHRHWSTPTVTPVPVVTATSTPIITSTVTPIITPIVMPTGTPTPGNTVRYEVECTGCSTVNLTFLDSDTTSSSQAISSGSWSSTVTISSGYQAMIVAAYGSGITVSPTLTVRIVVNGVTQATQSLSGIGPAITASYWLP